MVVGALLGPERTGRSLPFVGWGLVVFSLGLAGVRTVLIPVGVGFGGAVGWSGFGV